MISFALNLAIMLLWLMLSSTRSGTDLVFGFLLGFLIISCFPGVLDSRRYRLRMVYSALYLAVFLREFVLSNIQLLGAILFRSKRKMDPRLIRYDIEGLSTLEILILSQSITLTPGTTSVYISPDRKTLVIHAFNGDSPDRVIDHINQTLRKALLRATRL